MRGARTPVVTLALLASAHTLVAGGCAPTCAEIAADREAFFARSARSAEPHMAVFVPFDLANGLVARRLAGRGEGSGGAISLRVAGQGLGELSLALAGLELLPARDDHLGFRIEIAARSGRREVLRITMDAEASLSVRPQRGSAEVRLRPEDLERLDARLGDGAARALADELRRLLPVALRPLADARVIAAAADPILAEVAEQARALVSGPLAPSLGALSRLSFRLPDALPIESVALRSRGAGGLTLLVHTTLPVDGGVGPEGSRSGEGVEVRLAGGLAAALANREIREGRLPGRYDRRGKPDPAGVFSAGLAWRSGTKPLKVHVWQTRGGDCLRAVVAGTPRLALEGDELVLSVDDGELESVRGPLLLELGLWLQGGWGRALAISHRMAARTRFDVAGQRLAARVIRATAESDELRFGVELKPVGRKGVGGIGPQRRPGRPQTALGAIRHAGERLARGGPRTSCSRKASSSP